MGVSARLVSPHLGLVVVVAAISVGAILVRLSEAPASVAAFYRVVFTTLPLIPVALWRYRGALRQLAIKDVVGAVLAGGALAIHFAAWFESLEWTSVAASVTIVQAQPLFVAVGAWIVLDEQLTYRLVGGSMIAVAGVVVISLDELFGGAVGANPLLGNTLALLGAVMAAGYVLAGRSLRQRVTLVPYVLIVYSVAAVGLCALVIASGVPLTGYPAREWLLFLGLAVGPGLLGHTVINWTLAHLRSSLVAVSLLGEPIGAALLAAVIFAEVPGMVTIIGGCVVLGGIAIVARATRNGNKT